MERNTILPVKVVYFLVLIFYLYFGEWPEMDADRVRWTLLRTIQWFFIFCLIVNVAIGVMLIRMEEFSTRVLREVVFSICLFDALLLAMMTELTGGFESFLFWVFLGLQIRNAISMPIASTQIVANLSVSVIYLCAGAFDIIVARSEEELENITGEPVVLRALLLVLMTACGYGLQVLIDKQRRMDAEEDEFDRRQSQLQASGRLAAEIAHQVKNPLGIINNAAFALGQATNENETAKRQVALIREEVNKADQIITKLMGYAQLVEGRLAKLDELDPDNRLLGRMSVRRLEAETLRDSILFVSGQWNPRMFGKPVPVKEDEVGQIVVGVSTNDSSNRPTGKTISLGTEENRRSLYVQVRRSKVLSFVDAFDAPSMEPNCTKRTVSTVAPQALMLMNNNFVISECRSMAGRLQHLAKGSLDTQLGLAWETTLGQAPSAGELAQSAAFVEKQTALFKTQKEKQPDLAALANYCQALLSSNAFIYVD